jgi:hypothetical protein
LNALDIGMLVRRGEGSLDVRSIGFCARLAEEEYVVEGARQAAVMISLLRRLKRAVPASREGAFEAG